jgi:hypothetical protein
MKDRQLTLFLVVVTNKHQWYHTVKTRKHADGGEFVNDEAGTAQYSWLVSCFDNGEILHQCLQVLLNPIGQHSVLTVDISYRLAKQGCPFCGKEVCLSLPELLSKRLAEGYRFCGVTGHFSPEC